MTESLQPLQNAGREGSELARAAGGRSDAPASPPSARPLPPVSQEEALGELLVSRLETAEHHGLPERTARRAIYLLRAAARVSSSSSSLGEIGGPECATFVH